MTDRTLTITVAGARGGSGTTTIAAALALYASRHASTELVAADIGSAAALLGLTAVPDRHERLKVADDLTLLKTATVQAHVSVVDAARLDTLTDAPAGLLLVVLRGPCYLGLRSIVASGLQADGIVLLGETGRSLTDRDVRDVCGVPVVAQIPVTANVARTIDAGLLATRALGMREFTDLGRYIDPIVARDADALSRLRHPSNSTRQHLPTTSPSPATTSPPLDSSPSESPFRIATDMPVPLCGTSRGGRATRIARRRVLTDAKEANSAPARVRSGVGRRSREDRSERDGRGSRRTKVSLERSRAAPGSRTSNVLHQFRNKLRSCSYPRQLAVGARQCALRHAT